MLTDENGGHYGSTLTGDCQKVLNVDYSFTKSHSWEIFSELMAVLTVSLLVLWR